MSTEPSTIVVRAWARLLRAHRLALASVEAALKRAELPPLAWYDVLLEVERAGETGIRPFQLERTMLLAQYNLSRLLDRIERAGYVRSTVCEEDGRGQVVHTTEKGRAIRRQMWPIYAHAIETVIGQSLNAAEIAALDGALGSLVERLA
jgi:DNA-binding MarR family transcriptional regulator